MDVPDVVEVRGLLLIAFASIACWTDLTERRIPNWLCGTALGMGLSFFYIQGGFPGFLSSLGGVTFAGGIFLFFYSLGGFGAGDVKLIGSLASLIGFPLCVRFVMYVAVAGGILGIWTLLKDKRWTKTLKNSFLRFLGAKDEEKTGDTVIDGEKQPETPRSVPYGTAVLMGILVLYLEGRI